MMHGRNFGRPTALLGLIALVVGGWLLFSTSDETRAGEEKNLRQVRDSQLPSAIEGVQGAPAHTMYVNRGPEKEKAARVLTDLHQAMARRGYTFVAMSPHVENADLKGWWVTYVAR